MSIGGGGTVLHPRMGRFSIVLSSPYLDGFEVEGVRREMFYVSSVERLVYEERGEREAENVGLDAL